MWRWRGDPSRRGFWIVEEPLWEIDGLSWGLWVEEEGEEDKGGKQEPSMNLHTLIRRRP